MSQDSNDHDPLQFGPIEPNWSMDYWGGLPPDPGDNMNAAMYTPPGRERVNMPSAPHEAGHDPIGQSHQRSRAFGITEQSEPDFSSPLRGDLTSALDENRFLFQHAAPVMETLYDQIANTHSMVLLTSAKGMVLHSLGDTDFLDKASRVAPLTMCTCQGWVLHDDAVRWAAARICSMTCRGTGSG